MKIKELQQIGIEKLKQEGIIDAVLKSKLLLSFLCQKPKEYLFIQEEENVLEKIEKEYLRKIEDLIKGQPIQYILNKQEFMKMSFYVDENVLIPRGDTEILVEESLKLIRPNSRVVDIGTGSGAIAIAISKYSDNVEVYGTDINPKTLEIAKKNAKYNLENKEIKWIVSNLFENLEKTEKFDMIISNPPYIESKIIPTLDRELQQEPLLALDGGEDGLDFYRKLANQAYLFLKPQGYLCLEIGYNQKEQVLELLKKNYKNIKTYQDYCRKG